jgi:hypothetical protein
MATLEITTTIGCTLMCTYCPQDELKRAYPGAEKSLTLDAFRQYLAKVPTHVRISFAGMSEPWLNPEATEMLRHALEQGHLVSVYTTLVRMSPADADEVVELLRQHHASVFRVVLHLPDAHGNMRGFRPGDDYEYALRRFLELRDEALLADFAVMTMSEAGAVDPAITHLVDRPTIRFRGNNRAGNVHAQLPEPPPSFRHEDPVVCRFTPFYDWNVLLPNGDVALCCNDYGLTRILGNLGTDAYDDLFTSPALNSLRLLNQRPGYSDASICKGCDSAVPEGDLHRPVPPTRRLVVQALRRRAGRLLPGSGSA